MIILAIHFSCVRRNRRRLVLEQNLSSSRRIYVHFVPDQARLTCKFHHHFSHAKTKQQGDTTRSSKSKKPHRQNGPYQADRPRDMLSILTFLRYPTLCLLSSLILPVEPIANRSVGSWILLALSLFLSFVLLLCCCFTWHGGQTTRLQHLLLIHRIWRRYYHRTAILPACQIKSLFIL